VLANQFLQRGTGIILGRCVSTLVLACDAGALARAEGHASACPGTPEARPSVSFGPLLKGQPRITRMISPVFRVKSLKRLSVEASIELMPPLTYANYLDLEKLLTLQKPRSTPAEHDEMLFIIIHQTYELWFKQLLHEFEKIKKDFSAGDLFGAIHSFKRTRTIMKTLVAQVDILETMTPSSFSSFRDRLETASGF